MIFNCLFCMDTGYFLNICIRLTSSAKVNSNDIALPQKWAVSWGVELALKSPYGRLYWWWSKKRKRFMIWQCLHFSGKPGEASQRHNAQCQVFLITHLEQTTKIISELLLSLPACWRIYFLHLLEWRLGPYIHYLHGCFVILAVCKAKQLRCQHTSAEMVGSCLLFLYHRCL